MSRRAPRPASTNCCGIETDRRSRRPHPRAGALPVGDAGGRRRAGVPGKDAEGRGLHRASHDLQRAGHRRHRESVCPDRHQRAASDVCRAYRRGADRRREALVASAVFRRGRRRPAVRPRRGRHEGRHRLRGGGGARSSRGERRQAERLDLVPDHRRRGKHRGQRHHQAAQMGGRQGREIRPLHPAGAEQRQCARRHHQDRPARLAQRHADRHRHAGATSLIPTAATIRSAAW